VLYQLSYCPPGLGGRSARIAAPYLVTICTPISDDMAMETEALAIETALAAREPTAVDRALSFLEDDPFFFRSGYARQRIARKLAGADMTEPQRVRTRRIVLAWVDGQLHPGRAGAARLAGAVADNEMRRALRARLRGDPEDVALRALYALIYVKHPGYTPEDLDRARERLLRDISGEPFAPTPSLQAAMRLWSPDWESELRDIAVVRGPRRAAAKALLQHVDRRRERKRRRASS
jgi:hypothetical protein